MAEGTTPVVSYEDQFSHLVPNYGSNSLNTKVVYRERFLSSMPDRQIACEVISSILLIDEDVVDTAFNELCLGDLQVVDENLFTSLWLFLSSPALTEIEIAFLRSVSASRCSRCKNTSQSLFFLDISGKKLLYNCSRCRNADAFTAIPPVCFSRAVFAERFPQSLPHRWHSITFNASAALGIGYTCLFSGSKEIFPNIPIEELAKSLRNGFQDVEKYEYVGKKSTGNCLQFYCNQRDRSAQSVQGSKVRKRMRETKKVHLCGGSFSVSLTKPGSIFVRVTHELHHEAARPHLELTSEDLFFIERSALQGLAPFQICEMLQKHSNRCFLWSQAYYQWCEISKKQFMRNQDPFVSSKLLLDTCKTLSRCFFNEAPYALGFITDIGKMLTRTHECSEVFIASTYKTNSSELELFAVLTTVFGTGFPIAYLFLQGSADGREGLVSRQSLISGFLNSVKAQLPALRPMFFFTDKDQGQMNSIRTVFKLQPSLCLWHMKRAIKFKIRDLKKFSTTIMTEEDEKKALNLITRNYNMHPYLCPGQQINTIRNRAVSDLSYLLSETKTQALHAYLLKNWYDCEKFETWGRRSEKDGIPFTRTTMMVEAHWKVLKRHYLILHNRPRVDFITQLIDTSLMPKFKNDYQLLSSGMKKPNSWKDFVNEWRTLSRRPCNQVYSTDNLSWN